VIILSKHPKTEEERLLLKLEKIKRLHKRPGTHGEKANAEEKIKIIEKKIKLLREVEKINQEAKAKCKEEIKQEEARKKAEQIRKAQEEFKRQKTREAQEEYERQKTRKEQNKKNKWRRNLEEWRKESHECKEERPKFAKECEERVKQQEKTDNNIDAKLIEAVERHDIDTVRILLEKGANVNAKNRIGWTPLTIARRNGRDWHGNYRETQMASLIRQYAEKVCSELYSAVQAADIPKIQALLEKGADVNSRDGRRVTPLMWAVIWNHKDVVKILLDKGAYVNLKDNWDRTALKYTTIRGNKIEIADMLKEAGAKE